MWVSSFRTNIPSFRLIIVSIGISFNAQGGKFEDRMSVYNPPMTHTLKVKVEVLAIPTLRLFWHSLRILIQVGCFKVCEKRSSENYWAPTCWTLAKQGYEECGTFEKISKTGCFPYVAAMRTRSFKKILQVTWF